MKRNSKTLLAAVLLLVSVLGIWSFTQKEKPKSLEVSGVEGVSDSLFNSYWYAGKAEISTYKLTQSRYGELHQGKATTIFVTEPFLKNKGVKPNNSQNSDDQVPVLKMNLLKKFGTGIYPYSMMLSTFTPMNQPVGMIKASASGQEWCGQIYSQMNQRKDHYDVVSYSYFEQEGDTEFKLPTVFTEDEIWSRIRLDYKKLPVGDISIIPGLYYTRLEQNTFEAEKATGSLSTGEKESIYTVTYPQRGRTLAITFNTAFPHQIMKWEETYADKRAPNKRLTTTAVLDQSKYIDYWNYNAEKYKSLRKELGVLY